jgi:hypothetical protein
LLLSVGDLTLASAVLLAMRVGGSLFNESQKSLAT